MNELEQLTNEVIRFRDERDWKQFHNPKDLALALSIEAGELNELFLWKSHEQVDTSKVKEELADILNYAILLAHTYDLDIPEIVREKLKVNALKYPVEKSKGKSTKYDQL
jgi:NTP pyrophosphatase (non-canonical NTP hydrolase)